MYGSMEKSMGKNSDTPITDAKSSFRQCISMSNLYIVRLMIDNNIVNVKNINNFLVKDICSFIRSKEIADFLIDFGLNWFNLETLNAFLTLYIQKDWSKKTISLLIDHGAKIPDYIKYSKAASIYFIINDKINCLDLVSLSNLLQICIDNGLSEDSIITLINQGGMLSNQIIDLINLPDDLFFEYTKNITYTIDKKLIIKCIQSNHIVKTKALCNSTTFSIEDYYDFCIYSIHDQIIDLYYFFIKYIEDNEILTYMILLEVVDGTCYEENILAIIANDLLSRIHLSDDKLLLFILADPFNLEKRIIDQYSHISKLNLGIDYHRYFKYHAYYSVIYEKIMKDIHSDWIGMHFTSNDEVKIRGCLDHCATLLNSLDF